MGLPKKLTEMQMKFAQELVTNEGRKTGTQCAIDAGYSKEAARQQASVLQNPKLYPLVVKYIGELREEYQKKYDVSFALYTDLQLFLSQLQHSQLLTMLSFL